MPDFTPTQHVLAWLVLVVALAGIVFGVIEIRLKFSKTAAPTSSVQQITQQLAAVTQKAAPSVYTVPTVSKDETPIQWCVRNGITKVDDVIGFEQMARRFQATNSYEDILAVYLANKVTA